MEYLIKTEIWPKLGLLGSVLINDKTMFGFEENIEVAVTHYKTLKITVT